MGFGDRVPIELPDARHRPAADGNGHSQSRATPRESEPPSFWCRVAFGRVIEANGVFDARKGERPWGNCEASPAGFDVGFFQGPEFEEARAFSGFIPAQYSVQLVRRKDRFGDFGDVDAPIDPLEIDSDLGDGADRDGDHPGRVRDAEVEIATIARPLDGRPPMRIDGETQ